MIVRSFCALLSVLRSISYPFFSGLLYLSAVHLLYYTFFTLPVSFCNRKKKKKNAPKADLYDRNKLADRMKYIRAQSICSKKCACRTCTLASNYTNFIPLSSFLAENCTTYRYFQKNLIFFFFFRQTELYNPLNCIDEKLGSI